MTPTELAELWKLEQLATPAKWFHIVGYGIGGNSSVSLGFNPLDNDGKPNADQEFVIAARNHMPALLSAARRVEVLEVALHHIQLYTDNDGEPTAYSINMISNIARAALKGATP